MKEGENEDGKVNFFHIGTPWEPLNWQRANLNQVIGSGKKELTDQLSRFIYQQIGEKYESWLKFLFAERMSKTL